MKRFITLLVVATLCFSGIAVAEQATMIDFSQLTANFTPTVEVTTQDGATETEQLNPENAETLLDFGEQAAGTFSQEDLARMRTSLAIENWDVELASSSQFVENQTRSLVRAATVRDTAERFANQAVMGVRVHFPQNDFHSWAMVQPPFEIPAYDDPAELPQGNFISEEAANAYENREQPAPGDKFLNNGIVKNVGTLRTVSVWVHGLNFPHGFSIVLQDENNEQQEIFLDYLNFTGWRQLTWENPNYVDNVRNRELRRLPLYPNLQPMRKLVGFRVYKDGSMEGGDFITYIKQVDITYDQAVLDLQQDINNEEVWGILQEREAERRQAEMRNLGNRQILRYLERRKMHDPTQEQTGGNQQ